jgi:hypothetical protein
MAIGAGAVWEYRTTGNNNYGGGFDSTLSGAGTDYSQQDTAFASYTNLACTNGTSTVTSSDGNFTSGLVGNCLNINTTANNFQAGFYFITGYTDANTITVDRSPVSGGNGTSGVGSIGGSIQTPLDAHVEVFVGGNKIWIKGGSYTLTQIVSPSSTSATNTTPIIVEGYKTTRGDYPKLTDRPFINVSTYQFLIGGWWEMRHIDMEGSPTSNVSGTVSSNGATFINCKAVNTSTGTNRHAFATTGVCHFYLCQGKSASSSGAAFNATSSRLINCYAYDSYQGVISSSGTIPILIGCVLDSNTIGYKPTTGQTNAMVIGCVFYNNTTQIDLNTSKRIPIIGNIFHTSTTAITDSTNNDVTPIKYNLFYNNTTNGTNVTIDSTNITGQDPLLTDPANGDFTLTAGSPALRAMPSLSWIGLVGDYKMNIGIDQDDLATQCYAFAC